MSYCRSAYFETLLSASHEKALAQFQRSHSIVCNLPHIRKITSMVARVKADGRK